MESRNLETKILKGSILFLMCTAFLLTTALFTSCSESSEIAIEDDADLISAIENASTSVIISTNSLPTAAQNDLDTDFSEDGIYEVNYAADLGFEVKMIGEEGSFTTEFNSAFFDVSGRLLEDSRRPNRGRRRSCFQIVFPFSVTMPDNTVITLEDREDRSLIREWYQNNPDATEKPNLVFPIEIEYQDGALETINDLDELLAAREGCKRVRCFDLVYPYSFEMPDASIITLNSKDDKHLIREWYRNNPGIRVRPVLQYPVDIEFQDGTIRTVNDETELQAAKESCS